MHSALIGYFRDALSEQLPDDLSARQEEGIAIQMENGPERFRADIAVLEDGSWRSGVAPVWAPGKESEGGVTVTEPVILEMEPATERWIEIREESGRLVTVIEILSPANKWGEGRDVYRRKQQAYIDARVNLVEIDLLRAGRHTLAFDWGLLEPERQTNYAVCVFRASRPFARAVYPSCMSRPLPVISVPLRQEDADIPVALQPLLNRAYSNGRHWQGDFTTPLLPTMPENQAAWVRERLLAAGLVCP